MINAISLKILEKYGVNPDIASEIINNQFTDAEQDILDGLDDFDFGDL